MLISISICNMHINILVFNKYKHLCRATWKTLIKFLMEIYHMSSASVETKYGLFVYLTAALMLMKTKQTTFSSYGPRMYSLISLITFEIPIECVSDSTRT